MAITREQYEQQRQALRDDRDLSFVADLAAAAYERSRRSSTAQKAFSSEEKKQYQSNLAFAGENMPTLERTMTYSQSIDNARRLLSSGYERQREDAERQFEQNALSRGMFGQLNTDRERQKLIAEVDMGRAQGIVGKGLEMRDENRAENLDRFGRAFDAYQSRVDASNSLLDRMTGDRQRQEDRAYQRQRDAINDAFQRQSLDIARM